MKILSYDKTKFKSCFSLLLPGIISQLVKNLPAMQETLVQFNSGSGRSAGEGIGYPLQYSWASLVAQLVKNSSAMQETRVRPLGWEDPLEKGKRLPTPVFWPGEFHRLYRKELDTTERLSLSYQ